MILKRNETASLEFDRLWAKVLQDAKFRKLVRARIKTAQENALKQTLEEYGFKLTQKDLRKFF